MKHNSNKILIWVLSWSVVILLVIYSPIGSPDLYIQNKYVVYNQGVNFSSGIPNTPKVQSYQQYEEPDLNLPTYTPATKTYTVNSSVTAAKIIGNTNYSVSETETNHAVSAQSAGGTATGGGFIFMNSHSDAQNKPTLQANGITTLSTNLNPTTNSTTTRQLVTEGSGDGGTDPGGDPTGNPIPVGDGFFILLLMAGGYALKKQLTFIKIS